MTLGRLSTLVVLVSWAFSAGCAGCSGDDARPWKLGELAPDAAPVTDAHEADVDATTPDAEPPSYPCPGDGTAPPVGAACPIDGQTCAYACGALPCSFCGGYACQGTWQPIEDGPAPACGQGCDPLDQTSCPDGYGCYFDADGVVVGPATFGCMPAGDAAFESGCDVPNDCQPGYACLARQEFRDAGERRCYQVCDPATQDGICGGPCDAFSAQGYPGIDDVGFCYFLGG